MGRVRLAKDSLSGLYSLNVSLVNNDTGKNVNVKMFLDTGSSLTSITETVAKDLRLEPDKLEREDIGGIGGMSSIPIAKNLELFILGEGSEPKIVKLKKIGINRDEIRRERRHGRGVDRRISVSTAGMVNLVGLDFIEQLKGKIVIDTVSSSGHIEW